MTTPPRVLVVEDDIAIAGEVVRGLREHGFEVELMGDGAGVVDRVVAGGIDAVVLDLMLPEVDGFEVLAGLADRASVPIVVLTARLALDARLEAFAAGAADFLPKPFFMEELVARLQARLGRIGDAPRVVRWGVVAVDLDARVVVVDGVDAVLTSHEFNVLAWLVGRPGRAATRAQIAEAALSAGGQTSERTLDSHIARIRKKLGADGKAIKTVWGVGYRFDRPTRS